VSTRPWDSSQFADVVPFSIPLRDVLETKVIEHLNVEWHLMLVQTPLLSIVALTSAHPVRTVDLLPWWRQAAPKLSDVFPWRKRVMSAKDLHLGNYLCGRRSLNFVVRYICFIVGVWLLFVDAVEFLWTRENTV